MRRVLMMGFGPVFYLWGITLLVKLVLWMW